MQEKAKVVSIQNDIVTVIPLDISVCIGCSNTECKTNGNIFTAINSGKFDISVGSEVRIGASGKKQLYQAFVSIGIPVMAAVSVWLFVPLVCADAGEGVRVGSALLALAVCAALLSRLARTRAKDLPEITEVL